MFNSKEYRARGWDSLRGKYWTAVLMCFIVLLVSQIVSFLLGSSDTKSSVLVTAYGILALIILFIVVNPLSVGLSRYFIEQAQDRVDMTNLVYPFRMNLTNIVVTSLIRDVKLFLWTLLFIVPGIIKNFEYAMIPYILSENPDLPSQRTFTLSRAMMTGNKWRLFKLGFSFIGWWLLAMLTFGIGTVLLVPYINASVTQFYFDVKADAYRRGLIQEGELSNTFEKEKIFDDRGDSFGI